EIGDANYDAVFSTDWSFRLDFKDWVNVLVPDFIWNIGTFPELGIGIISSPGDNLILRPAGAPSGTTSTTTPSSTTPKDSDGGDSPVLSIPIIAGFVIVIIYRKEK
ncbi:MAG: hypothetical protein ACW99A_18700, partial [Candidatus Kariarchaeaceae archaeon]